MKAIQVSQTGGPEVLVPVDLPVPKPKANEAVVARTEATKQAWTKARLA